MISYAAYAAASTEHATVVEDSSIAVESPPMEETAPASGGPETFDFRDPGQSIREGIRHLESAHEAFAAHLERSLSDSFGLTIRLNLEAIEQSSFDRYLAGLPTPAVLGVLTLNPLPGTAIFELSAGVGLPLVEAMLGGGVQVSEDRKLTEMERKLLQGVADEAVGALTSAFAPLGLDIEVDTWNADPQFMHGSEGELVILVRYSLTFGDEEDAQVRDRLLLAYPLAALQALADGDLEASATDGVDEVVPNSPAWLGDHLPDVPIPFAVRLQTSLVPFGDVASLEPGDVLRLDHAIDDSVIGLVGPLPLLIGRLGMSTHKLAMEIAGWIEND